MSGVIVYYQLTSAFHSAANYYCMNSVKVLMRKLYINSAMHKCCGSGEYTRGHFNPTLCKT